MKRKLYLTTTLPYVNAAPHIGHTLEFVQADVISRYFREKLGEDNTFFNLGTDEHGLKIYNKAIEQEKAPREYADFYAEKWRQFCSLYKIKYDNFYRTTDPKHKKKAQKFWRLMQENGLIYKKKYEGLYCIGCESFKTDKDLVDGLCPDHQKEPINYSEENYFLKISHATEKLLKFLKDNPDFITPANKQKALVNFVKEGLRDISISRMRKNLPWGISVPEDPDQVMYVWFDALTNYIFAVGYMDEEDPEQFNEWWPAVQICGPDNIKFQGAIWQAMLALADIPFTKKLLVHGMVMGEDGNKMSKTIGNVIDPTELADKFPVEAIRFYLIAGCATYDDFAFSRTRLIDLYNDGLADKYGNLINRVIHLAKKSAVETAWEAVKDSAEIDPKLRKKVDDTIAQFHLLMEQYYLNDAYSEIIRLCSWANQYITEKAPWSKENSPDQNKQTLIGLIYLLWNVTDCYKSVIPDSASKAASMLKNSETGVLFEKL